MYCPSCHQEISSDVSYCPHCGVKLIECPICHEKNIAQANYCIYCGNPLEQRVFHEEKKEVEVVREKKPLNIKKVLIGVLCLIIATGGSIYYVNHSPRVQLQADGQKTYDKATFTVTSFSDIEKKSNINNEGNVYFSGQYIYMTDDNGYLVKLNKDFSFNKAILNEKVSYINVEGDTIYYADENNYLCSISTDGENKQTLLKDKVFYVHVQDSMIYYQKDTDSESLYSYNIKTKEDTKLVNRHVYNINKVGDLLYFKSNGGIYSYNLKTKKTEKIIDGDDYYLLYSDNYLYYVKSSYLMRVNVDSKKEENIGIAISRPFVMSEKALYFISTDATVKRVDLSTKNVTSIYKIDSSDTTLQILDDNLIIKSGDHWVTVNTSDTNYAQIFEG